MDELMKIEKFQELFNTFDMEKTSILFNKSNYNFTGSTESHNMVISNEILELSNSLSQSSKKADEKLLQDFISESLSNSSQTVILLALGLSCALLIIFNCFFIPVTYTVYKKRNKKSRPKESRMSKHTHRIHLGLHCLVMFASVFFIAMFASTVNNYYNKTNSFDFLKIIKDFYGSLREEQVVSVKETTKIAYEKGIIIVEDTKVNENEGKDDGKNGDENDGKQEQVDIGGDTDNKDKEKENDKQKEKEEDVIHGDKDNTTKEGNEEDILKEDDKKPENKETKGEDNETQKEEENKVTDPQEDNNPENNKEKEGNNEEMKPQDQDKPSGDDTQPKSDGEETKNEGEKKPENNETPSGEETKPKSDGEVPQNKEKEEHQDRETPSEDTKPKSDGEGTENKGKTEQETEQDNSKEDKKEEEEKQKSDQQTDETSGQNNGNEDQSLNNNQPLNNDTNNTTTEKNSTSTSNPDNLLILRQLLLNQPQSPSYSGNQAFLRNAKTLKNSNSFKIQFPLLKEQFNSYVYSVKCSMEVIQSHERAKLLCEKHIGQKQQIFLGDWSKIVSAHPTSRFYSIFEEQQIYDLFQIQFCHHLLRLNHELINEFVANTKEEVLMFLFQISVCLGLLFAFWIPFFKDSSKAKKAERRFELVNQL